MLRAPSSLVYVLFGVLKSKPLKFKPNRPHTALVVVKISVQMTFELRLPFIRSPVKWYFKIPLFRSAQRKAGRKEANGSCPMEAMASLDASNRSCPIEAIQWKLSNGIRRMETIYGLQARLRWRCWKRKTCEMWKPKRDNKILWYNLRIQRCPKPVLAIWL